MCATCGCAADEVRVTSVGTTTAGHLHGEARDHDHAHAHEDATRTHTIDLQQRILAKNDHLAQHNRHWLAQRGVMAVNLMSSPGAGKTSLLERTIRESGKTITVIEGDQETLFDAERIRAAGAKAVQVNTGSGCHLDATMVQRALEELQPEEGIVFVENVGNLVCPALFDLGETRRVVVISITEGDDKPLKYPHMFSAADLVVVNKIDLLPYVEFDLARLARDARKLQQDIEILPVSVRSGENMPAWHAWLRRL